MSLHLFKPMDTTGSKIQTAEPPRLRLPERLEVEAVMRFLGPLKTGMKACLDVGFDNASASLLLRGAGGYWTTVARDAARQQACAEALGTPVDSLGPSGQLPFEDKQFDVVVLAHGCLLGRAPDDERLIGEVHRVLKAGGLIVLTVEYAKMFGFAYLLNHRRLVAGAGGRFSEGGVFDLLKNGFDLLGTRHFCRFWMQMVRQWADRRSRRGGSDRSAGKWIELLYQVAHVMNLPISFGKGYLMTACGRRKGWRPRHIPVLADGRRFSEAVLKSF